jgi:ribosome-binding factor A
VGDVVVPPHLEKWILDPEGDHRKRYKSQRLKEERLKEWYEKHGMYYKRRKQSGFRRDPQFEHLTIRQRRVGLMLKEAIERVFAEDLEHEQLPGITIEDVQIGVDMKRAKVMWTNSSGMETEDQIKGFLYRMVPTIRHLVTQRVKLKYSPVLEFLHSDKVQRIQQVENTMEEIRHESDRQIANNKD